MKYDFLKNAKVNVTKSADGKGRSAAIIVVGDGTGEKFEHKFAHNSRISKHLTVMTPTQLSERLTGGSYFFVDENLYDFREGNYKGHIIQAVVSIKKSLYFNTWYI